MSILPKLKQLDKMVADGLIIDAFDRFFDDKVVTHSENGDRSNNKAQKREWLVKFFSLIQKINSIKLHGHTVTGNVSHSKFTFKFTTTWGDKLVFDEVIRRTWKNGLVVDEYYYEGELPTSKSTPSSTKRKTTPKTPAKRRAGAPRNADDLTKIEGIGPKIAGVLQAKNIKSFGQLAAAKPERLRKILAEAGPRYKMHDPSTWPQQAALAKAGKWEQLKELQSKLKRGRK